MSAYSLYDIWFRRIRELLFQEWIIRARNLVWMSSACTWDNRCI